MNRLNPPTLTLTLPWIILSGLIWMHLLRPARHDLLVLHKVRFLNLLLQCSNLDLINTSWCFASPQRNQMSSSNSNGIGQRSSLRTEKKKRQNRVMLPEDFSFPERLDIILFVDLYTLHRCWCRIWPKCCCVKIKFTLEYFLFILKIVFPSCRRTICILTIDNNKVNLYLCIYLFHFVVFCITSRLKRAKMFI